MNEHQGAFPQRAGTPSFSDRALAPVVVDSREVGAVRAAPEDARFGLEDIWRTMKKWWWLIAATTVAAVMLAIGISFLITPEYRAEVILEVNPEGVQVMEKMGELEPVGGGSDEQFLTTQAGLIRSQTLAERVSRALGLANNELFAPQDTTRPAREAAAAEKLRTSLEVTQARDSRLLKVAIDSSDPTLAANLANSYADNFIQSNLERKYEATSYARGFLEQRIAAVKARLEKSERDLVAYAQRQGIINIAAESSDPAARSEQSIDATTLVQLNETLSTARGDRIAAEQRYRQSQNRATTTSLDNPVIQTLSQQRAELQAEYQDKLNIYQPAFPVMVQLRSRIQALGKAIADENSNVSRALESEFQAAAGRERALEARVNALKAALLNLRARSIQYTILQREVDTNRALYDALLQRFKEVGVAGGVGANHVSIIDRARVPEAPFKPNLPLNIALGLVAGLLLGFGAAFAIEWIDDTVKTPDDVKAKLGIPSLGVIPVSPVGQTVMDQLGDRRSTISEAYQSIRTALQFSTDHGVPRALLVTSTRAAEGKSSTTLALAHTLASLGSTVLIVDADLRKPTFRGPEGSTNGLATLLAGSKEVREAISKTELDNLYLLPGGSIPPNPAELLASDRFSTVLAELREMFDFVIVDGPPVLGLADAPLLASVCEGTLMVIEAGSIRRAAAKNAVDRLRAADARIAGGVLSKFNAARTGYGYGYGYGSQDLYAYEEGAEPKKQIELIKSS